MTRRLLLPLLTLPLLACELVGSDGGPAGVDTEALFAPATAAEIDAVLADWAGRDVGVYDLEVERSDTVRANNAAGYLYAYDVVSHTVGEARHYGAIVRPFGLEDVEGPLPVVVYAHGGEDVNVGEEVGLLLAAYPVLRGALIVVPSFRSETLTVNDSLAFTSTGAPSPWDRDVDDALALLNAALARAPEADPDDVSVLGFSRGAAVGLLMAIRDARIRRVVDFFGPTDFLGPFARDVIQPALVNNPPRLPGVSALDALVAQPLKLGRISIDEARLQLVRRSPVLFADRLPAVQVHHGEDDRIVPIGESERLAAAVAALGGEPAFAFFRYPDAGHFPLEMPESFTRANRFLAGEAVEGAAFAAAAP